VNQLGLTEWIGALLVVFVALALTGSPTVGAVVARSKWTPIVWFIAFGIGCVGELLLRRNVFLDRRFAVAYWAPVYELFIYWLALSLSSISKARAAGRQPQLEFWTSLGSRLCHCCWSGLDTSDGIAY
jgi:hypothetical protein